MRILNDFNTPSEMVQRAKREVNFQRRRNPEAKSHVIEVYDESRKVWVTVHWDEAYGFYNIQFHFYRPDSRSTKISRRDAEKKFGVADANWW